MVTIWVLRDLQVKMTTTGTGIYLDNAAYLECFRIALVMDVSGGVTSIGVDIDGAEMDMTESYLTGDPNNSGGSVTLLRVANGEAYLINSGADSVAEDEDGDLVGIVTLSGGEVDIVGGDYLVEREVEGSDLVDLTGVTKLMDVASGSRVNVKNAEMKAFKFADDGSASGTTLVNNGGFTAFSVWLDGTYPLSNGGANEFYNDDTDHLQYFQCFGGGEGEI